MHTLSHSDMDFVTTVFELPQFKSFFFMCKSSTSICIFGL